MERNLLLEGGAEGGELMSRLTRAQEGYMKLQLTIKLLFYSGERTGAFLMRRLTGVDF